MKTNTIKKAFENTKNIKYAKNMLKLIQNGYTNFQYCRIIKDIVFASDSEMDWLIGEWILAGTEKIIKNKKEINDIRVPRLIMSVGSENENLDEAISKIQKHWPFKVNIEGKDYNILPAALYNYSDDSYKDTMEEFSETIFIKIFEYVPDIIKDKIETNRFWSLSLTENVIPIKLNQIKTTTVYDQMIL